MEFKIDGLDNFMDRLSNVDKSFEKEADKTIKKVVSFTIRDVKKNTPVAKENGGTLRRSWSQKKINKYEYIVYTNVEYAPHIEYGHRTRQGTGKAKKYRPKEGGIRFVKGRYMLTNAIVRAEDKFINEIETLIENLWEDK